MKAAYNLKKAKNWYAGLQYNL